MQAPTGWGGLAERRALEKRIDAAVEKAYLGILEELAAHGAKPRQTIQVALPRIAQELGVDWRGPEFAHLVEEAINEDAFRPYSSGEVEDNIYIAVGGFFNKVAVAGLYREKGGKDKCP